VKVRADALTDELVERLSGADVERFDRLAIIVCTSDADGWPHPAILSYFEVAAVDRHTLRLAVYNDSRTCANLRERGKATLVITDERLVCYVRGTVTEIAPAMRVASFNAVLRMHVDQVVFDEPPPDLEPGAYLTSGITYHQRTEPSLERARAVLAELRQP
jgi:pyridoxamine 5'-phosphate oxidase-like protein